MIDVLVRKAELEDIDLLLANIRKEDLQEMEAVNPHNIRGRLEHGVTKSVEAYSGFADGELVCMFGVCRFSILSNTGIPWLLSTNKIKDYPITFLRHSKEYMSRMILRFDTLENYVDVRNTDAIHWLKWLGFEISEPVPYGKKGQLFHRFEMGLDNV